MTQSEIIDLSLTENNQCSDWIDYPINIRGATGGFLGNIPVICGGTNELSEIQNSGGCNQGWIGDGYCDDMNNIEICNYDGGDCCGDNVNTQYCFRCQCHSGGNLMARSKFMRSNNIS